MDILGHARDQVAPLVNRNFRWLFGGRIISVIGDNLYIVASMWLVYELTGSTVFTGISAFLANVPQSLGFVAGPIIDRYSARSILVGTELVQMTIVLSIPLAASIGELNIWIVLTVIPLLTLSNQFARPAQDAVLPRILDDDKLAEANSLFLMANRGMQAISKAISGILISLIGAVALYGVNAVTFLFGAAAFSLLNLQCLNADTDDRDEEAGTRRERVRQYLRELNEGKSVVVRSAVLHISAGTAFANFLTSFSMAVLPAFASNIGGSTAYGALYGGAALGLFVGAVVASSVKEYPFGWLSIAIFSFASLFWIAAVLMPLFSATLVCFTLAWVPIGIYNVLAVTVQQTGIPDGLIGRVMAVTSSVSAVLSATGVLVGGVVGELLSSDQVILISGVGFLFVSLYWMMFSTTRSFPAITAIDAGAFSIETENLDRVDTEN